MRTLVPVCLLLSLISGHQAALTKRPIKRHPEFGLSRAKARPDLAVDLSTVAQLKLASRKTRYRVGETISADLAIINVSQHPIFFCKPSETFVAFRAKDAVGKAVDVWPYSEVDFLAMTESYRAVGPEESIYAHFRILAGRDDNAFRMREDNWNLEQSKEPHHLRAIFDRNLFVDWGDAYLDAEVPGTYIITAEYLNDWVLVDPANPKTKTATGTMVSAPLRITVTD